VPEGDTIHRTAGRLRPALVGADLVRFAAPRLLGDRPVPGTRISDVEAVGKHLLIHFDGGLSLQTHMRMTGSWHLYRSGERWRKAPHLARAIVEVDGWVAVCFNAPVVRTYRRDAPGGPLGTARHPTAHLGPDLCGTDVAEADIDECVRRMGIYAGDDPIGVALLDQRVACGVGNVYKSETLFACGIDPFVTVTDLDEPDRRRLLAMSSKLLRANLGNGPRTTLPGGLAVYGRHRQPCRRCGTLICMRRQGEQARSTYWCPTCQPPHGTAPHVGLSAPHP